MRKLFFILALLAVFRSAFAHVDFSHDALQSFVWAGDLPLSITDYQSGTAGTYFYVHDGNRNVVALTSAADSSLAAQYNYNPFGGITGMTGLMAAANPLRFSSEYYDDETDLIYYIFRYYDPATGRWWSREPLEIHPLYGFVNNDPINFWDFLGLEKRVSTFTGYTVAGTGHHVIPFEVWDEIQFDKSAQEFFDSDKARIPTPNKHNNTAHPRYTHEIRYEWEQFLNSKSGKKYKDCCNSYGKEAGEAFFKHIQSSGNKYIDGFNTAVKSGPAAVFQWYKKTGSKIPPSTFKTSIWKNIAQRCGKKIPFVSSLIGAGVYSATLDNARASGKSETAAQVEALSEVANPIPISQQDIRDGEKAGKEWIEKRQRGLDKYLDED